MLRIRVQLGSALGLLERLVDRLADAEELLAPALPVAAAAVERNFDEEGRPLPWPPLSPAYARWKARHFPGRKILERTGRLRRSIRTTIEGNALVLSTDVPYAAAHQFGLPARRSSRAQSRGLPARPFLVLTESDQQEAAQAIADSLGSTDHASQTTEHEP